MRLSRSANAAPAPSLSLVLIDWNVRESYHILKYLSNQSIPRNNYEIIWVEFYKNEPEPISTASNSASEASPIIDTWIILDQEEEFIFHKHLLYNAGIVSARGDIVCFFDSDAIVSPTFCESIITTFETDPKVVLHLDQVRNENQEHYPFDYPSVEQLHADSENCRNLTNGRPTGILPNSDPLHLPNYGSCMAAMRADLVEIGGADEHLDYAGFICGPYELTYRLRNYGHREIWHPTEWLYHCWHPGAGGGLDYCGPEDGAKLSSTALEILDTGRIGPLRMNPAIAQKQSGTQSEPDLQKEMLNSRALGWEYSKINHFPPRSWTPRKRQRFCKRYELLLNGSSFRELTFQYLYANDMLSVPSSNEDIFPPEFPSRMLEEWDWRISRSPAEMRFMVYLQIITDLEPERVVDFAHHAVVSKEKEDLRFLLITFFWMEFYHESLELVKILCREFPEDQHFKQCAPIISETQDQIATEGLGLNSLEELPALVQLTLRRHTWELPDNQYIQVHSLPVGSDLVIAGMGQNGRAAIKHLQHHPIPAIENISVWDDKIQAGGCTATGLTTTAPRNWDSWPNNCFCLITPQNGEAMAKVLIESLKRHLLNQNISQIVIGMVEDTDQQFIRLLVDAKLSNLALHGWDLRKNQESVEKLGLPPSDPTQWKHWPANCMVILAQPQTFAVRDILQSIPGYAPELVFDQIICSIA